LNAGFLIKTWPEFNEFWQESMKFVDSVGNPQRRDTIPDRYKDFMIMDVLGLTRHEIEALKNGDDFFEYYHHVNYAIAVFLMRNPLAGVKNKKQNQNQVMPFDQPPDWNLDTTP
jgi:hypothetical protein